MPAAPSLDRFLEAQDRVIADVRRELAEGHKRSHWMWFVFPQLAGLGHSPAARFYGIASLAEARAYLAHPVLGPRLAECAGLVNGTRGRTVQQVFGHPDDLKFRSCMTLFAAAQPGPSVFAEALRTHFGGAGDPLTEALLRAEARP